VIRRVATLVSIPLLLAGIARAAAAEAEGGSGGLPQFDPTHFPSQIFWLIVAFGVLYRLFTRRALPRIFEILEERQDRIAADLDRAAELRREAEEIYARHERMLEEARERAHALILEAQQRIARESAARQAALDRELQERIAAAEAEISRFRERALADIADVAAEIAAAAAEKLAGLKVAPAEVRPVIERLHRRGDRP